jgi:hemoglobin
MSIYADIGGSAALDAAVTHFYQRLLADESLVGYFDGIDLDRLKRHQRAFLSMALGGPNEYKGRNMAAAHAGLGITNQAFSSVPSICPTPWKAWASRTRKSLPSCAR